MKINRNSKEWQEVQQIVAKHINLVTNASNPPHVYVEGFSECTDAIVNYIHKEA